MQLKPNLLAALAALGLGSAPSWAILVRDDVDEARYWADASQFGGLVDLSPEGHGVLIAPDWVLTAAHATLGSDLRRTGVTIGGKIRAVSAVVRHEKFAAPPADFASWTLSDNKSFLLAMDDIALIKLEAPVTDVEPIAIASGAIEPGARFEFAGRGRFGTGSAGQITGSNPAQRLRFARNRIDEVNGHWFVYTFDCDARALELEGFQGAGDSGTPLLIDHDGKRQVIGLISWRWNGRRSSAGPAYGAQGYALRLADYADWIVATTQSHAPD